MKLGGTVPLVTLAKGTARECKQTLDAGATGVIVPMIGSAAQLIRVRDDCRWPPTGGRGVGFSRANYYGEIFYGYAADAQEPLLIAKKKYVKALDQLDLILQVEGLDALFIGPYDLSASLGLTGQFRAEEFSKVMKTISGRCAVIEERVVCMWRCRMFQFSCSV